MTAPVTGADPLPPSLSISPPWAPGITHNITRAYGVGTHIHVNTLGMTNDYYALDFDLALDEAVYPVAEGTVIYAGTATGGFATFGQIVFVEHNVGGELYESLYAHLDTLDVSTGDQVTPAVRLGGAGGTGGWPVHLHVSMYHNAKFQFTGGKGPYGGVAVVPEPIGQCDANTGACENFVATNQLIRSSGGNGCACDGGSAYLDVPIDPDMTFCGFRVCGNDRHYYDCDATGWQWMGGTGPSCGVTTCRCDGGTAYPGIAIDPQMTSCGFRVCGNDKHFYSCGATGWEYEGGDCL